MTAPCLKDDARARKNLAAILHGLGSVGQAKVADALKTSESTVSRMKDDELVAAARFLSLCGLKVVPERWRCVDPKYMDAILVLAGQHIDRLREKPDLVWESDE